MLPAVALTSAAAIALALPGAVLVSRFGDLVARPARAALVVVAMGLQCWLLFWSWFVHPALGWVAVVAIPAASMAVLLRPAWRPDRDLLGVLGLTVLAACAAVAFASNRGVVDEAQGIHHTIAVRYWVSSDSVIPEQFAELLVTDRPLDVDIQPGWQTSDRPPLGVGAVLALWSVVREQPASLAALALAGSMWVPALDALLDVLSVARWRRRAVVGACVFTGAVYVNTVYVWPKMLAAALTLAAAALLLQARRDRSAFTGAAGVVAIALALLAHGSSLFVVPLAALVALGIARGSSARAVVGCAATGAALYLPWLAFQRWVAPPGDRLVRWHLAGTSISTPDTRPLLRSIAAEYRDAGIGEVVVNKLINLELVVNPFRDRSPTALPGWTDGVDLFRASQLTTVAGSLGPLLVLVPLLAWPAVRRAAWFVPLAVVTLVTTVTYVLVEWGGTRQASAWLHTAPLGVVHVLVALAVLALTEVVPGRWCALGGAVLAVTFWFTWDVSAASAAGWPEDDRQLLLTLLAAGLYALVAATTVCTREMWRSSAVSRGSG